MAYANTEDDVNNPSAGEPTPGRIVLLTPRNFELLDYAKSPLIHLQLLILPGGLIVTVQRHAALIN